MNSATVYTNRWNPFVDFFLLSCPVGVCIYLSHDSKASFEGSHYYGGTAHVSSSCNYTLHWGTVRNRLLVHLNRRARSFSVLWYRLRLYKPTQLSHVFSLSVQCEE